MHGIGDSDDDIHYNDISYNIDAPLSTLLANSTERCNKSFGSNIKNGVRMQRNIWVNLDTKSKEIWDQLDDKAKSIIFGYETQCSNSSYTSFKEVSKTNLLPQQKMNVHDMSEYDLLQVYASQVHHPTSEMEELVDPNDNTNETPSDTPSDDVDTRLICAATSSGNSKLPPGDICCDISKASTQFVYKFEYLVSKHDHTFNMPLVDHGANGCVSRNDVCALF
jgi:hypothetical protein